MNSVDTASFPGRQLPPISNGRLGTLLLVGTETILFASFIGAYLVLRMGASVWPPAGTPILPLTLSVFNTSVLVMSSLLLYTRKEKGLVGVLLMGMLFLFLQGIEFHRLYARGLTLQTGSYGALFYSLITCHGLHVLGGLAFLAAAWRQASRVGDAELYWHFVTGVWLILFAILYLF